jgi:hypothetical protein
MEMSSAIQRGWVFTLELQATPYNEAMLRQVPEETEFNPFKAKPPPIERPHEDIVSILGFVPYNPTIVRVVLNNQRKTVH